MTETEHNPQRIARIWRSHAWLVALAALAVAGCSSSAGSTAVHATPDSPATSESTSPSAPLAAPTPPSAPTVTVTVTTAPAPAPAPTTVAQPAAHSTFQSPSGNINCMMFTSGGQIGARCEVVDHTWVAPPRSPDCHLNWGDRFHLTQGGDAGFNCYGQEFPTAEQTLAYGQKRSLGTINCDSEYTGMTCTDSSTGHYFRISREGYELG